MINFWIRHLITLGALLILSAPLLGFTQEANETDEQWHCSGYCFMGGDTPTNPWIPVSSTGASEQEARDNIDCGRFVEVDITCRRVQNHTIIN